MWNNRQHIILVLNLIMFKNIIHLNFATENENLSEAISIIVEQSFINETKLQNVLFFSNVDKNSTESRFVVNDLTSRVLQKISNGTYKISYNTQKQYANFKHNEVVLLDTVKTFKYFFGKLEHTRSKDLARTLLFISSLTTLDYDTIYLIFKDLYIAEMLRVALIIRLANYDIVILTYFPFTQTSCRDFKPVIINRYLADERRWENNKYFPTKLANFYGCPIYCCTWRGMPYFGTIKDKTNGNITDYVGFEAELLKFTASSVNATIEIRWMKGKKSDIENQESAFAKIFSQHCDIALGAFNYRNDLETTAFSQTNFHSFSNIYIVTNIINFQTKYEKLASPFSYKVWFVLGLIYALNSLLICTCERQRKWLGYRNFLIGSANKTPHLNFYALGVGNSMTTTHMPKRNFARFLLICWILLMFILRVAYQSGMYQMLRNNKQWNPPRTIASVFEQKYLISTTPEYHKYFAILPATQRVRILNTTIWKAFREVLNAKEPIALITPYEYYDYFGQKNGSQWNNLHLVKERLLTQQLTVYVRHRSHLLGVLNRKIMYSQLYGFTNMWTRKTRLVRKKLFTHKPENSLSMSELGAIFMILFWLHILAFVVFLIELMWRRYKNVIYQKNL